MPVLTEIVSASSATFRGTLVFAIILLPLYLRRRNTEMIGSLVVPVETLQSLATIERHSVHWTNDATLPSVVATFPKSHCGKLEKSDSSVLFEVHKDSDGEVADSTTALADVAPHKIPQHGQGHLSSLENDMGHLFWIMGASNI